MTKPTSTWSSSSAAGEVGVAVVKKTIEVPSDSSLSSFRFMHFFLHNFLTLTFSSNCLQNYLFMLLMEDFAGDVRDVALWYKYLKVKMRRWYWCHRILEKIKSRNGKEWRYSEIILLWDHLDDFLWTFKKNVLRSLPTNILA